MLIQVLCISSVLALAAPNRTYSLYADIKDSIDFVPYTPLQRSTVANAVAHMFKVFIAEKIYVNREPKISNYGKEYPNIDPIPRIDEMVRRAENMTDKEMHYGFSDIFFSLRDLHTNYYFPGPHACVSVYKAARFAAVGYAETEKIVFAGYSQVGDIMRLSPQVRNMTVGDELVAIDGIPLRKYLDGYKWTAGGSNEYGFLKIALARLSSVNGKLVALPEKISTTYEMKSLAHNHTFTVDLPWIAGTDTECWKEARRITDAIKSGQTIQPALVPANRKPKFDTRFDSTNDHIIDTFIQNFGDNAVTSSLVVNTTSDPIIKWAIYKPETKNMGIIYMESFKPVDGSLSGVISLIKSLLTGPLKNTKSVLFDVRSNRGGIIGMADWIPQLFATNVNTIGGRALIHPYNRDLLFKSVISLLEPWARSYLTTLPGQKYTPIVRFSTTMSANQLGRAYNKPVGVFTNAKCYSACEMFAADMKDNKVAIIFGEDAQTGGGGANVVEYNNFLNAEQPNDFPQLPFQYEMPLATQDFRLGWRQTVRMDGTLMEDVGVLSDMIVRPTIADLYPDTGSSLQYDQIADVLAK